jgi:serine phosphatase RsbU (regulator of sigma subunit)
MPGNLPPFCDGKELLVTGSLPLGLSAGATYEEIDFRLGEDETLVVYTDGIVEARNARGDLFGFDRIARLLADRPPLQEILDHACAFGQQDDITILSVARVPAAETRASAVRLTAQIAPA